MTRWIVAALLLLTIHTVEAARPPLIQRGAPGVIVEVLPRGYADLEPRGEAKPTVDLAGVERLLGVAQRTGDARLASRAEAQWLALPAKVRTTPRALELYAFIVQHRHDFNGSLALLQRVLHAEPFNPSALLARAQIYLVLGRIRQARGDCGRLALGADQPSALVCVAAFSERIGDYARARDLIERWLAEPSSRPAYRRYMLVSRAEIAARSGDEDAERWFRQALALDPQDVRTLAAYARFLTRAGRADQTRRLLASAPRTDPLLLQDALAAAALRSADRNRVAAALSARYALAHSLGSEPELRDEAELLLATGKPQAALALAKRNFQTQRDYEDVDILERAARAAREPAAVKVVEDWARSESIDPRKAGGRS